MKHGATKMLNHVALKIYQVRLNAAVREELLIVMPAMFMEAYRQSLALGRITEEPKKHFSVNKH
jgi:hypothetical protein